MFFKNFKVWETELAGRKLSIETGKMAGLANAAVMVRYGDTNVLCTVTASAKPREGVDFFPLSVDYEEKMYSVGKIPGSFQRREGKASEKAVLTSRCIDRPIRPLSRRISAMTAQLLQPLCRLTPIAVPKSQL